MKRPVIFSAVLVLVAGGFSAAVVWQRQTASALRAEVEFQREQEKSRAGLEAETARLRAKQISAADLEALRGDRAALARLRAASSTCSRTRSSRPASSSAPAP